MLYKLREPWKDGTYTGMEKIIKKHDTREYIGINVIQIVNNCIVYYAMLQKCVNDPLFEVYIGTTITIDEYGRAYTTTVYDHVNRGHDDQGKEIILPMRDETIRDKFNNLRKDATPIPDVSYFDNISNYVR